jgi:hypothetical protein
MTTTPSPIGEQILKPFVVGLKITAHSLWAVLRFALAMAAVGAVIGAICGTMYGYWWLINRSAWYIIPLSVPVIIVMIWMTGKAALMTREAVARNDARYADYAESGSTLDYPGAPPDY